MSVSDRIKFLELLAFTLYLFTNKESGAKT